MKKISYMLIILSIIFIGTGCDSNSNSNNNSQSERSYSENITVEENNDDSINNSEIKKTEKQKYTEEEYKSLCEKIDYKKIARSPDDSIGTKVYGTGEVIQVIDEDTEMATFRINVTPEMNYDNTEVLYYTDTVLAVIYNYDMNNRLLEDDIIDFWGIARGNYTYETVLGDSNTVPLIQIDYFDLK